MHRNRVLPAVAFTLLLCMATYMVGCSRKISGPIAPLSIAYPLDGTVFPSDIAPPTFRWSDPDGDISEWLVEVSFGEGEASLEAETDNASWTPSAGHWRTMKELSTGGTAKVTVTGIRSDGRGARRGSVSIHTAKDPVSAPLFYREVNLPFVDAVKDPSHIRWRFGLVSSPEQPPVVLQGLPVCGNCHSFSADGSEFGMDIDYANDKGSYAISRVEPDTVIDKDKIITWSDYRRSDGVQTFGLLSQMSPDGRYVVSTVKDRSVFVPKPDLMFSQLFFPIKGILVVYDRQEKRYFPLKGADDPRYVQSNPAWSPDGKHIVFARAEAYTLKGLTERESVLLEAKDCEEFLKGGKKFRFDLYRVPFNGGKGGEAIPLKGASKNGVSNFFAKYSPDGKWIVFCKADSFMLLQPDAELWIMPAEGGEARRMKCNTTRMNSWHTWSPNSRYLAFTSKANGPYSQVFLTHIDDDGNSSPPVELAHFTASDRAANIPEFVNTEGAALTRIIENFVDDYSYWRAGNEYLRADDWRGAERMFRKSLKLNPSFAKAHNSLGAMLSKQGNTSEAMAHFEKALAANPECTESMCDMGVYLAGAGKIDDAIGWFKKALQVNPENAVAHKLLAMALVEGKKRDEALRHFRKSLSLDSHDVETHLYLGYALYEEGQVDEAILHYKKALEIDPGRVDAHLNLGVALDGRGEIDEAIAHYRKTVELRPESVQAHNNLGTALLQRRQFDDAIRHLQCALDLDPTQAGIRRNMELALQMREHAESAAAGDGTPAGARKTADEMIARYEKMLKEDRDSLKLRMNLATLLAKSGRLEEAITHLQKAVKMRPDSVGARNNLGAALLGCGRYDEAIVQFEKAITLKPDQEVLTGNLEYARKARKQILDSLARQRKRVLDRPNDPALLADLAEMLATNPNASIRNPVEAVGLARRAADLSKGKAPGILRTLASAYAAADRFDDAASEARKALALAAAGKQAELVKSLRAELARYEAMTKAGK